MNTSRRVYMTRPVMTRERGFEGVFITRRGGGRPGATVTILSRLISQPSLQASLLFLPPSRLDFTRISDLAPSFLQVGEGRGETLATPLAKRSYRIVLIGGGWREGSV